MSRIKTAHAPRKEKRLREAMRVAAARCPTLQCKRVSPHTLRHTTAMHLLHSGVDITVIALWLGHESTETTHPYVEANLIMKEEALLNGRVPKGSAKSQAKLTEETVKMIRREAPATQEDYQRLGELLGVSPATIRDAAIGRRWKHVA